MSFEDDLLDAEARGRGAVFHHYSMTARKTKFLVVLNHTWPPPAGLVVYAFATSNLDYFARAGIPEAAIVRLSPGEYPFVKVPTVIDLTRPEVEELSAIVRAPDFKFVVQLRAEHLQAIDEAVRSSTLVSRRHKKMILAGFG